MKLPKFLKKLTGSSKNSSREALQYNTSKYDDPRATRHSQQRNSHRQQDLAQNNYYNNNDDEDDYHNFNYTEDEYFYPHDNRNAVSQQDNYSHNYNDYGNQRATASAAGTYQHFENHDGINYEGNNSNFINNNKRNYSVQKQNNRQSQYREYIESAPNNFGNYTSDDLESATEWSQPRQSYSSSNRQSRRENWDEGRQRLTSKKSIKQNFKQIAMTDETPRRKPSMARRLSKISTKALLSSNEKSEREIQEEVTFINELKKLGFEHYYDPETRGVITYHEIILRFYSFIGYDIKKIKKRCPNGNWVKVKNIESMVLGQTYSNQNDNKQNSAENYYDANSGGGILDGSSSGEKKKKDLTFGILFLKPKQTYFWAANEHDRDESYLVLNGSCMMQIRDKVTNNIKGDFLHVPANEVHGITCGKNESVVVGYVHRTLKNLLNCNDLKYSRERRSTAIAVAGNDSYGEMKTSMNKGIGDIDLNPLLNSVANGFGPQMTSYNADNRPIITAGSTVQNMFNKFQRDRAAGNLQLNVNNGLQQATVSKKSSQYQPNRPMSSGGLAKVDEIPDVSFNHSNCNTQSKLLPQPENPIIRTVSPVSMQSSAMARNFPSQVSPINQMIQQSNLNRNTSVGLSSNCSISSRTPRKITKNHSLIMQQNLKHQNMVLQQLESDDNWCFSRSFDTQDGEGTTTGISTLASGGGQMHVMPQKPNQQQQQNFQNFEPNALTNFGTNNQSNYPSDRATSGSSFQGTKQQLSNAQNSNDWNMAVQPLNNGTYIHLNSRPSPYNQNNGRFVTVPGLTRDDYNHQVYRRGSV